MDGFRAEVTLDGGCVELEVRRGGTPGLTVDGSPAAAVELPTDGARVRAVLVL